jgi:hypothetical protein
MIDAVERLWLTPTGSRESVLNGRSDEVIA